MRIFKSVSAALNATDKKRIKRASWYTYDGPKLLLDDNHAKYEVDIKRGEKIGIIETPTRIHLLHEDLPTVVFKLSNAEKAKVLRKAQPYVGKIKNLKVGDATEATTPKATTPKATTPKATTPKATTPKATRTTRQTGSKPDSKLDTNKVKINQLTPENFPMLTKLFSRRPDTWLDVLEVYREGLKNGEIKKADFNSGKAVFGRIRSAILSFEGAYRKNFSYDVWGKIPHVYEELDNALRQLAEAIEFFSPYTNKDLNITKRYAVEDLKAIMHETYYLLKVRNELSITVVSPKKVDPKDEFRRTCSCCLGKYLTLKSGKMVHHGYEREWGAKINSCQGIDFLPLEDSVEGGKHFLKDAKKSLAFYQKNLHESKTGKKKYYDDIRHKESRNADGRVTKKRDPEVWYDVKARYERVTGHTIERIEVYIAALERSIKRFS